MSQDGRSTPGRSRPTYGLPGPTPGDGEAGAPSGHAQSGHAQPGHAQPGHAQSGHAQSAYGHPGYGPSDPYATSSAAPPPASDPPKHRRRGVIPLVVGLVLLVVVGPVAFIGGLVWSLGALAGDTMNGPEVLAGGSGQVEIGTNEMVIVYVPAADAAGATCTAEGADGADVSTVPSSGTVEFPDGTTYEQTIGVLAHEDSSVTITCTGTDAPAYLGPYSLFGIAGPLLIGPIIGVLAGLVGLVLIIIGAVKLARSGRS